MRTRARLGHAVVALMATMLLASRVAAQEGVSAMPQWEAHLHAVASPVGGAAAGVGANVRAGWYTRLSLVATAGAVGQDGRTVARLDAAARFLFDPFAERGRGFHAGAGIGVERVAGGEARPLLLGLVGVEGAAVGRVVPAVEVVLGGGVRIALVLRGKRPQGR